MALKVKWGSQFDDTTVHCSMCWDERGNTGAALKIDARVRRLPDEPANDTSARAIEEARRIARAFLAAQGE